MEVESVIWLRMSAMPSVWMFFAFAVLLVQAVPSIAQVHDTLALPSIGAEDGLSPNGLNVTPLNPLEAKGVSDPIQQEYPPSLDQTSLAVGLGRRSVPTQNQPSQNRPDTARELRAFMCAVFGLRVCFSDIR